MLLSLESHKSGYRYRKFYNISSVTVWTEGEYKREGLVNLEFQMWLFWVWKVRSLSPFLVYSIFFVCIEKSVLEFKVTFLRCHLSRWQSFSRREKLRANSVGKDMVVMVLFRRWVGRCSSWRMAEASTASTFHSPENWAHRGVTKYVFKEITFSFSSLGDHP